jgi:ligand-binding sensor domain-containing protein
MKSIVSLTFLIVLLCYGKTFAHSPVLQFRNFGMESPLSSNNVYDVIQDNAGYMWFATYDGLYRYDGYTFTQFDPQDSNVDFHNGPTYCIFKDHLGCLWVSDISTGILVIDPHGKLKSVYYYDCEAHHTPLKQFVTNIAEDSHGNIWMGSWKGGPLKWDRQKNTFFNYKKGQLGLRTDDFNSVYLDRSGTFWLGSFNDGLYYYDDHRNTFSHLEIKPLEGEAVNAITENYKGDLYIGTTHALLKLDRRTGSCATILNSASASKLLNVQNLFYDSLTHIIWAGTKYEGVYVVNEKDNGIINYSNRRSDNTTIINNCVNKTFKDRTGNIWIGTAEGACIINELQRKINYYTTSQDSANTLTSKYVKAIYKDEEGNLWIGTFGGGLNKISPSGRISHYTLKQIPGTYGYQNIYCITGDKEHVYLGTAYGVVVVDKKLDKITDSWPIFPLRSAFVWDIWKDKQGLFWIGLNHEGLVQYNPEKQSMKRYLPPDTGHSATFSYSVWRIYGDKQGILWLGTNHGLKKMTPTGNDLKIESYSKVKESKKVGENIFDMLEDENGNLWLATMDDGVEKFERKTGKISSYTTDNGLPSNSVCGVLEDDHGMLWLSTLKGICVLDPRHGTVKGTYTATDGLQANQFSFASRFKDSKGVMYFGGLNGYNSYDPEAIKSPGINISPLITSVKSLYSDHTPEIYSTTKIDVPYNDNTLFIDFALPDYEDPNKNRFAYKLSGSDTSWHYIGDHHYTSFTNLSPGSYTFYLKGQNSNGFWSKTIRLRFYVEYPFWMTWWFIVLCVAILAATLLIIYRSITKGRERKRNQLKTELFALRSQLNPHFVFNSLNSLLSFIIKNENTLAITYLARFSKLMRLILSNSKKESISLEEEIVFLELYFYMESYRYSDKVKFNIHIDEFIPKNSVYLPPMIIQPFIENSIIHGLVADIKGGQIDVKFKKDDDCLYVTVEDNGIGREQAMKNHKFITKESMAIKIISERLNLLPRKNGHQASVEVIDKKDPNGKPTGTKVELKLPLYTHVELEML